MPSPLEKVVAQKKEAIEAVMELFERGAEVLASTVGELLPLCEAAAPVLRLALDNVQSKEVFYVKEQFVTVRNKLEVLSSELEDIDREIKKGCLDSQYFTVEENLCNQFRKYLDILEAKPQFREVKTRLFLDHFKKTGGEKNLHILYDALMGNSTFGGSVLEVVDKYETRNRRVLEDFCVRMKELFCLGLIALLGNYALTQDEDTEQEKISEWSKKIQEVETKMKAAVEECVRSFAEQARLDVQRLLREKEGGSLQDKAKELLHFLARKYDWLRWSIRIVSQSGSSYQKWRAGENFQHVAGQNWFDDANVVVSYSSNPQPVPKESVQQLMDGPAKKGNAKFVVETLEKNLPGFVVHAISRHKESYAAWNFPEDCHHWERHKNVALCVHSDEC
ncbi:protein rapunzel-like [Electrophorus electricus]|uniref:Rapunzel 4 n=1 Tax=Electrophorus electricus TaxID=8005 RepID=A0A4W4GAT2_ELEEL|nr:protein rapunzel-like [Electrophorus electricus]XP_026869409.2 protein rapunzel-like [Electrophorus electricus]